MDINGINTGLAPSYVNNTSENKNEMGQQQFLQLLVAQMRHQDPTNPLDGAEFASQLAQFNSVEQLINMNAGIRSLQDNLDMMSVGLTNSMAASLAGKEVKAMTNTVNLPVGDSTDVHFKLQGSASRVELVIRNESGGEIKRVTLENLPGGDHSWKWDGLNSAGDRMPEGNYYVSVEAKQGDSGVDALTFMKGFVDAVRFTGNGVYLQINGVDIPIGNVEEITSNTQF